MAPPQTDQPIRLELALQGGGAHGAFTWGVLDRLLDEPRIRIVAISGASAGAMNAVLVAHGLGAGGPQMAKAALNQFWKEVADSARAIQTASAAFDMMAPPPDLPHTAFGPLSLWAATHAAWRAFAERSVAGFGRVPQDLNPLGKILEKLVDFDALRKPDAVRLFISATDVGTGALRVFRNEDMSALAVLASACLPQVFQCVEIEGNRYWDGGYVANPPLAPLIAESRGDDLLIVQLHPPITTESPKTPDAIAARVNEISFNASLMNELRGIRTLKHALAALPETVRTNDSLLDRLAELRLHLIVADETTFGSSHRSKMNPDWTRLQALHRAGHHAADQWLQQCGDRLGRESTIDDPVTINLP